MPSERIFVFVADEAEAEAYRPHIDDDHDYGALIVAKPGMMEVRNFINEFFPEGQRVVQIDDDIRDVRRRLNDKETEPVANLAGHFSEAFHYLEVLGLGLWGIYPVPNPMFMKSRVRRDLSYVPGGLFGTVNTHDETHRVSLDDKEDFERSMKFYLRDGGVLRFDNICMKTTGYSGKGGMQEDRTDERIDWSARELYRRYPYLCRLNTTKKSGKTELRLRDRRPQ